MAIAEFAAVANWYDLAILILIGLYTWQGWERGLYLVVPECLSWVGAWLAAILYAERTAHFMIAYLGLWHASSWLWSFILMVIVVEQLLYRSLMLLFALLPKQYFSHFWQLILGVVPAFLSGIMVMAFLTLILLLVPINYPFKQDIETSWFGMKVYETVNTVHLNWVNQEIER
jgi:uncharacterized membrane protein required for colicin V production